MTFFEEYLASHQQTPTPLRYGSREDEAALAFLLLQERLKRGSAHTGYYFSLPESLDALSDFALENQYNPDDLPTAIRFVTTFLCYFIPKLTGFRRDIEAFREHFIPGLWEDSGKQVQLIGGLRSEFYSMTTEDLRTATSLSIYMNPTAATAAVTA